MVLFASIFWWSYLLAFGIPATVPRKLYCVNSLPGLPFSVPLLIVSVIFRCDSPAVFGGTVADSVFVCVCGLSAAVAVWNQDLLC